MGMVKYVGIATLILAGQAFAASIVNYTVEVAPYNAAYVAAWKNGTNRMFFPAGNAADGQQFTVGTVLTWDVVVTLDPNGTHVQAGHPSNGFKPYGVANVVFNLELTTAADAAVTTGAFYSAINDGTAGDPVAAAAFAASLNATDPVGNPKGPGRLIDQVVQTATLGGGPNMDIFTYPTAVPGKMQLLGEGAGYIEWRRESATNSTRTVPGVGLVTLPNGSPGLGVLPLFEGQIDTTNMLPGTYKLKVTPGSGVNVLRGDYTDFMTKDRDAFAVAANQQNGDVITFTLTAPPVCPVAPVVASAVSNRVHGAAGTFGIPLTLGGTPAVECRDGGPQQIVVSYDKPIAASDGTLDTEVTLSAGNLSGAPIITGNTLTINLGNVPNATCLAITINGITCAGGGTSAPATVLRVVYQKGDVTGDGTVDILDIGTVKINSLKPVTPANAQVDITADGAIDILDIGTVKSLALKNPPPTCN